MPNPAPLLQFSLYRIFVDELGVDSYGCSVLAELGGFEVKEARFRREMEKLKSSQQRDISIEVDRDRDLLLPQVRTGAGFGSVEGQLFSPLEQKYDFASHHSQNI